MIKVMIKFLVGSLLPVLVFGLVNIALNHDVKQARAPTLLQKVNKEKTDKLLEGGNGGTIPSTAENGQTDRDVPDRVVPPVYVTDELPHTGDSHGAILSSIGYLILGSLLFIKRRIQQLN